MKAKVKATGVIVDVIAVKKTNGQEIQQAQTPDFQLAIMTSGGKSTFYAHELQFIKTDYKKYAIAGIVIIIVLFFLLK